MFSRRLKTGYFVIEGLNSFATVYYFYYLYFFMQKVHGFGNQANLMLAALNGATYALVAWFAGRFAQKHGYFTALKVGFGIMILSLGVGLGVRSSAAHVWVMVFTVVGMSFTWPTLEALVSEGEPRAGLQHMVGIYNVVWAATAALEISVEGQCSRKLGLASLFYVPMAIHGAQLGLTWWLESKANARPDGDSSLIAETIARVETDGFVAEGLVATALESSKSTAGGLAVARLAELNAVAGRVGPGLADSQAAARPAAPGEKVGARRDVIRRQAAGVPRVVEQVAASAKEKRFLSMAWLANPFCLYSNQYVDRGHPRSGAEARIIDHGGRLLLLNVVLCAFRSFCGAVALDRMALSFPLAVAGICRTGWFVWGGGAGTESGSSGNGATCFWNRCRPHLLLVAFLFYGPK
jgi:hypothetical protein